MRWRASSGSTPSRGGGTRPAGSGPWRRSGPGNWSEADRALRELQERYARSALVPQAKYWRVRVKQLAGGKPVEEYQDILKLYPQTFYGLLAQERLRELGAKPEADLHRAAEAAVQGRRGARARAAPGAGERGAVARVGRGAARPASARCTRPRRRSGSGRPWRGWARRGRRTTWRTGCLWAKAYGQKDPGGARPALPAAVREPRGRDGASAGRPRLAAVRDHAARERVPAGPTERGAGAGPDAADGAHGERDRPGAAARPAGAGRAVPAGAEPGPVGLVRGPAARSASCTQCSSPRPTTRGRR